MIELGADAAHAVVLAEVRGLPAQQPVRAASNAPAPTDNQTSPRYTESSAASATHFTSSSHAPAGPATAGLTSKYITLDVAVNYIWLAETTLLE
ncbi:hypothetical protein N7488_012420 [Penicillium malachiteum]|nr:hypothetical protein N7488_012420 [Penicillium malachiteum]